MDLYSELPGSNAHQRPQFEVIGRWHKIPPITTIRVAWINAGTGTRSVRNFDKIELAAAHVRRRRRSGDVIVSIDAIRATQASSLRLHEPVEWPRR